MRNNVAYSSAAEKASHNAYDAIVGYNVPISPLNNPGKSSPVVRDPQTLVSPSIRSFVRLAVRIRLSSINQRRLLRPHGATAAYPPRRRGWPAAAGRRRTVRNSDRRCWWRLLARQQFRRHHVTMEIRLRRRPARN